MSKLLTALFIAGVLSVLGAVEKTNLIQSIERVTLHKGRDGGVTWFLPRVCMVPQVKGATAPSALMTLQTISGSDYYGPVHWRESKDTGKNWIEPQPIPGFGRRPFSVESSSGASGEIEEAVSDVLPTYHAKTNTVIALGEIIYYREGRYFPEQPPRYPVYAVRDAKGNWSERRKLEWDDPRANTIYSAGSSQLVVLKNGDVLIPVSFRPKERTDYAVTTLLCSFDGQQLKIKRVGTTLINIVKRGLLEPQLTFFDNRYLMTIRAEDGYGYVSTSTDGLNWSEAVSWKWDNGEPLVMSTTQQHWLTHSDGLFLAYTRKAEENSNVMRWRAPLYLAQVDRKTLRLILSTEQIVFPLIGDGISDPTHVPHYGNFHVNNVNAQESWILAGEVIPANFRGDMLLARVRWNLPNRLK